MSEPQPEKAVFTHRQDTVSGLPPARERPKLPVLPVRKLAAEPSPSIRPWIFKQPDAN
jgi:hypothetical protein